VSYLKSQNRPYSATDISSNLHNKVTKSKADKFLKEMFERKEIDGKVLGKQWVYWCLQVCCSHSRCQRETHIAVDKVPMIRGNGLI
jgi:hypothetical protein